MNRHLVKIKICGLTQPVDCLAVNHNQVDYAGFVFAPSRRQVDADTAARLIALLDPAVCSVGVFVDHSETEIQQIVRETGIKVVQLHGSASPERIKNLRQLLPAGIEVWQRLPVSLDQPAAESLAEVKRLITFFKSEQQVPDAWLLDSCRTGQVGGTGETFDWSVFQNLNLNVPFVLAGGINAKNVLSALQNLQPAIVDVSSGVESNGRKDPAKIDFFCTTVRQGEINMNNNQPGRFGQYGGQYAAETLMPALAELDKAYRAAMQDPAFINEYHRLLREYAGRPSLLYRAERISRELGFTVLLKREDLNHTGAHKINNVLGQVLLASRMGKKHLIAETGAGQHGVATATAAALFGLSCDVFMGAEDTARQALNVYRMELLGATVHAVTSGTATLKDATSEAMREWSRRAEDTFYVIGSTMGPHPYPTMVRDFQRVIGDEIRAQMLTDYGRLPDALIACVGGGSNAMGTFYPFINDAGVRLIGAEAAGEGLETGRHAATMTLGSLGVFHGMHSLFLQDDDGQIAPVYSISAGLDYPGIGPEHVYLQEIKRAQYQAVTDQEAVDAFSWLARLEGIIPAIESAHALALLRRMAASGEFRPEDQVVVTLSGRGDKDVASIQEWQRQHPSANSDQGGALK